MKFSSAVLANIVAVAALFASSSARSADPQPGALAQLPAMQATRCVSPAAQYHSVNPWVLKAILKIESGFNAGAVNRNPNNTVDVGMAQMNSMHFPELRQYGIAPGHLLDGCIATYVAAWQLAKQMKLYGNTWFGIASYHSATPCFNSRYAGLLWNALVDMGALAGQRIQVKSLEQCGFVRTKSSGAKSMAIASASVAAVAFDAE